MIVPGKSRGFSSTVAALRRTDRRATRLKHRLMQPGKVLRPARMGESPIQMHCHQLQEKPSVQDTYAREVIWMWSTPVQIWDDFALPVATSRQVPAPGMKDRNGSSYTESCRLLILTANEWKEWL